MGRKVRIRPFVRRRREVDLHFGFGQRVFQVYVVFYAPTEVLVEGRGFVEHVSHGRDAGGVPRY